jgi:negative regulator of sigma E activity
MHYRNTHERAARNEFAIVRSQTFFKFRGLVQYFAVVDSLSEVPMQTDILEDEGDVLNILFDVKFNSQG